MMAEALQRARQGRQHSDVNEHDGRGETGKSAAADDVAEPDEIDRMIGLIEAASAKVRALDLGQVEAAFVSQAVALDVIFGQFTRAAGHKYWTFDSMRVALRAQAQSRATYKSLIDLKTPRRERRAQSKPVVRSLGERGFEQTDY